MDWILQYYNCAWSGCEVKFQCLWWDWSISMRRTWIPTTNFSCALTPDLELWECQNTCMYAVRACWRGRSFLHVHCTSVCVHGRAWLIACCVRVHANLMSILHARSAEVWIRTRSDRNIQHVVGKLYINVLLSREKEITCAADMMASVASAAKPRVANSIWYVRRLRNTTGPVKWNGRVTNAGSEQGAGRWCFWGIVGIAVHLVQGSILPKGISEEASVGRLYYVRFSA